MKFRRKLNRKMLSWLPDGMRLDLIRSKARVQHEWPSPSLEIKIARTEEELETAYRLLHDSYVDSGFMTPHPSGMRVLAQHLLPQTTTIVAKWDGKVIGTLSLIRDNPLGLPLERLFDLSARRSGGRRLAEVSSLAVDKSFRGRVSTALFPLFRFVFQYARDCFGTHEFVIAVNPSTVDMYLGLMCFKRLDVQIKSYDFVNGVAAAGLFLNFEEAQKRWVEVFAHRPTRSNFHKYWTEIPNEVRNQLPRRNLSEATDPILTPDLLKDFFLEKAQLKNRLTFFEIQTVLATYPGLHDVFASALKSNLREGIRMDVQMTAEVGDKRVKTQVWNVSKDGLLIVAKPEDIGIAKQTEVVVWLNESKSIQLQCEVCWKTEDGLCGLRILLPSTQWLNMIRTMELPYNVPTRAKATLKRVG